MRKNDKFKRHLVFSVLLILSLVFLGDIGEAAKFQLEVKVRKANVRSKPNLESAVITQVSLGIKLESEEQIGNWFKIKIVPKEGKRKVVGYIHQSTVNVLVDLKEAAEKKRARAEEKTQKSKKFFVKFNYNMGFSEDSQPISWTKEIYFENASYNIDYNLKKGNSFDFGVGYKFSNAIGIELGADLRSRNLNSDYRTSIPHPLYFSASREAQNTGSYKLTENVIYLNFVYSVAFSKFGLDFFGGPAYFLSSIELIGEIQISETSYPYETIGMSARTENLKKNSFGFNGGASFNYYPVDSFGIFINAKYFTSSADFKPSSDIPGWKITLGGFKAGAGLKILF